MAASTHRQLIRNDGWKPPRLQRPARPRLELLGDGFGDVAYGLVGQLGAQRRGQMVLNVAGWIAAAREDTARALRRPGRYLPLGTPYRFRPCLSRRGAPRSALAICAATVAPQAAALYALLANANKGADLKPHAVSDESLARALGIFAGMASKVLNNPERWLAIGGNASGYSGAIQAAKSRAFGQMNPASSEWDRQPVNERVSWWVSHIAASAGTAAAAPRVAGLLSDRVPLQAALSASASGLAVCAVAREHGVTEPGEWVPLLGKVVFKRNIDKQNVAIPHLAESEQGLLRADNSLSNDADDPTSADSESTGGGGRAARTLWRLAGAFRDLQALLDQRPRGNFLARAVTKAPVAGAVAGWFDERGGIQKAAKETQRALT